MKDLKQLIVSPNTHTYEDGCIEWTRSLDQDGYGKFHTTRKQYRIHRYVWELANGPIPEGWCVCHHCDNRKCYNIHHLFIGTSKDNSDDRTRKGRSDRGESRYNAKLNPDKVRQIRALDGKMKQRDIGAMFGVRQSTIWHILRGHRWKHVS